MCERLVVYEFLRMQRGKIPVCVHAVDYRRCRCNSAAVAKSSTIVPQTVKPKTGTITNRCALCFVKLFQSTGCIAGTHPSWISSAITRTWLETALLRGSMPASVTTRHSEQFYSGLIRFWSESAYTVLLYRILYSDVTVFKKNLSVDCKLCDPHVRCILCLVPGATPHCILDPCCIFYCV